MITITTSVTDEMKEIERRTLFKAWRTLVDYFEMHLTWKVDDQHLNSAIKVASIYRKLMYAILLIHWPSKLPLEIFMSFLNNVLNIIYGSYLLWKRSPNKEPHLKFSIYFYALLLLRLLDLLNLKARSSLSRPILTIFLNASLSHCHLKNVKHGTNHVLTMSCMSLNIHQHYFPSLFWLRWKQYLAKNSGIWAAIHLSNNFRIAFKCSA